MWQMILNCAIEGMAIGLLALAFTIVYLPTRVFFIALAGVYTIVPFVARELMSYGLAPEYSFGLAILLGAALSLTAGWGNHLPLQEKGAGDGAHLVSSLGIFMILTAVTSMIWGSQPGKFGIGNWSWEESGVILAGSQLWIFVTCLCLFVLFFVALRFTRIGLYFRAMADNQVELALRGLNLQKLNLLAFTVSGALAAVAALLNATDAAFDFQSGLPAFILGVIATIIGGRNSFAGPIAGGLLVGILRGLIVWSLSAKWQDAAVFLLLVAVLLFLPRGLMGRKERLEVQ